MTMRALGKLCSQLRILLLGFACAILPVWGQAGKPAGATPAFDVVIIKPNKTGSGSVHISTRDQYFQATNVSVKMLLFNAYDLKEDQLIGLPRWAETDRFDITAKVVDGDPATLNNLSHEQRAAMLQTILTDRFQVKFHYETKNLPIYEMIVGKDGPKFQESKATDAPDDKGVNGVRAGGVSVHNTEMTATAVPLAALAGTLSGQLHRIVVDKTGLMGKYDLVLKWSPEDAPAGSDAAANPDLLTALQEQLGLKLRGSKADVETMVVDQVQQPSEN